LEENKKVRKRGMWVNGKVKVGFFIDKNLAGKFRSLIQQKYQNYEKGLLSYKAEMALRHWLSLHTNAQNTLETNKPNPTPKSSIVFSEVRDYLLRNLYHELKPGQQIPRVHLERGIMATRGSDPRTIRKWLRTFHRMRLAKPITSATWEIM
jgi:hypothetical protein